ncbi:MULTISPECIES: ABC transporter permease [Priestia]|uniref:ABC transporter permease n=1 Tax=Priestia TaxID=2800373 RepID=UPI00077C814A|nr:ABC transporter permease [Priestia flexa]MED4588496.1 ABC transporter permease [Priestia flexa]
MKSIVYLASLHAKFQLLEAFRIPISIVMSLISPTIGLLFFVLPQQSAGASSDAITKSVIALVIFGVMVNSLFHFAVEISQARERPWGSYTRSLPVGQGAILLSYLFSSGVLSLISVIPLLLMAIILTDASMGVINLIIGVISLVMTCIPFMLLGIAIGYFSVPKAAVAIVQVLMLILAFGGGLFIPPDTFNELFNNLSYMLPSRSSLEIVSWGTGINNDFPLKGLIGWITWTFLLLVIIILKIKNEVDREY